MSEQPANLDRRVVEEVFYTALALSGAERAAYLDQVGAQDERLRRRVEALLRVSETGAGFLPERPKVNAASSAPPGTAITEQPGDRIGNYELVERIGTGGFGVVFKARQLAPVQRWVALKILKLGMDTEEVIARFEAERQVLAALEHPNIAKVFDAGATTAGRPYFVMELVAGSTLNDFADQNRLTTRARLELFAAVCSAVQHAHTKGIIHRDLKPSNVLVTIRDGEAVPMLIDFGIAKATEKSLGFHTVATALGVLGTPAYMSPEQADLQRPDIDTRSDIYSLGVLLYELLTGLTPFEPADMLRLALNEVLRTIREQEPPRPSDRLGSLARQKLTETALERQIEPARLKHVLRGDLDAIVMKCLEKDRNRRYDSASGLAQDVRRHLANEPISAASPGVGQRLLKWTRRNKITFRLGTTGLLLALAGGLGWWFLPGNLFLEVTPADTRMEIDGRPQAAGKVPSQLKLAAGIHQLHFFKAEFREEFRTVLVPHGGSASLKPVTLNHQQGKLEVECSPGGTGIRFAGVDYFDHIRDLPADTGRYDLLGFGDGFFDVHRAITIRPEERTTERLSLENGVSWRYLSPEVQGECLVITNCPPGQPSVIMENFLDRIVFLSSGKGLALASYPVANGNFHNLNRLMIGGPIGSILVTGAEAPDTGPVLTVFADAWPMHVLWEWRGPKAGVLRPAGLRVICVPNSTGPDRIAVAGQDGHIRLLDSRTGIQYQDLVIATNNLDANPDLAIWTSTGQTCLLAMLRRADHKATNRVGYDFEGILARADTGEICWRKSFGFNQGLHIADSDRAGVPEIVLCDAHQCRAYSAATGEKLSSYALPGPVAFMQTASLATSGPPAVLLGFADPHLPLLAIRPADGTVLWQGPTNLFPVQPENAARQCYRTSAGALLVMLNDSLIALNPATGARLWQTTAHPPNIVADEHNGDIYATLDKQNLLCLNADGSTNWVLRLHQLVWPKALVPGPGEGHPNVVLQNNGQGITSVHWPTCLWSLPSEAALSAAPLVTTGPGGEVNLIQLLAGKNDSALNWLNARTGRKWFADTTISLSPNRPPALGDLDGNGVQAVITIGTDIQEAKRKLFVHRALDGKLVRAREIDSSSWVGCTPAVADFRGIGKGDVAVATWNDPAIILLDGRSGTQLWRQSTGGPNEGGLVAADLDHNGRPEVICASGDGHVYALRGGTGEIYWETVETNYASISRPTVADLDGDGQLEVLVTTVDGQLYVLDGRNGGQLWHPEVAGHSKLAGQAVVTTIDGYTIILAPLGTAGVVAFDWRSRRELWHSPAGHAVIASPVLADLVHDGRREVVLGDTAGEVFVLQLADGRVRWHAKIAQGLIEADPVVADVNHDGTNDILIASHDGTLYAIDGRVVTAGWSRP